MNHDELKALNPCLEGMEFAAKYQTLAEAWQACDRADWLTWLAFQKGWMTKKQAVRIAHSADEARKAGCCYAFTASATDAKDAAFYANLSVAASSQNMLNRALADVVRQVLGNPLAHPVAAAGEQEGECSTTR